ncbi:relaxase/mobilization nuclease domain-containing protein [Microseira wollei]|uniref:relaxase/mobilization nuclease domain-containing protein n=1 Tax=Microseira wollei TaxID=467598 RepID=UPI001CFC5239|nr:relaxase/mobilization nuclease domain-containing protein [Microseira wollei]
MKQTIGDQFYPCLNYVLSKQDAVLIGGNMEGETPAELVEEFQLSIQQHHRLKAKEGKRTTQKMVYHASLSVPIGQRLSDKNWQFISHDYLRGMGFDDNQYVLVRHQDTQHDHCHIVACRLKLDGTVVNSSWNYYRDQKVLRQLETAYNLEPVASSWEIERTAPSTGQMRRMMKEQVRYEQGLRLLPPIEPVNRRIQHIIDEESTKQPTLTQLVKRLRNSGVEVFPKISETGIIQGLTFELEGIRFPGYKLGRAYSLPGLQKYRGIHFDPERDIVALQLTNRGTDNTEISTEFIDEFEVQQQRTQIVAPIVAAYLVSLNRTGMRGNHYLFCLLIGKSVNWC